MKFEIELVKIFRIFRKLLLAGVGAGFDIKLEPKSELSSIRNLSQTPVRFKTGVGSRVGPDSNRSGAVAGV